MPPPTKHLAVQPQPQCPISRRCHSNGKGINLFGSKFPGAKVRELASSSVLLGGPDVFHNDAFTLVASGTLVANNVVLCAAHSLSSFADKDIQIFMFFECDQATAPPGNRDQYSSGADFLNCTKVRPTTKPIARGVKTLERGNGIGEDFDLDYALLAIEWTDFTIDDGTGEKVVEVPRFPVVGQASRSFSQELVLIAHPNDEPTQASAGTLVQQFGPHPQTKTGIDYGYASFFATSGSSGGGVFNESGALIGVLNGRRFDIAGNAFLNLGRVADTKKNTTRITQFLDQATRPVFPGDPVESVRFKVVP